MAKKATTKVEIEEAQVIEEQPAGTSVILTKYEEKQVFPSILNKDTSLETIRKANEKYSAIVIDGTKDKENYNLVVAGIRENRESRIAFLRSYTENVLDPAKAWLAEEKTALDAIEAEFKSTEATLKTKKEAIDQAKKDEKAAEEKKRLERMSGRIEKVVTLGGKKEGELYGFDFDITLTVSLAEIKDLEDAQWDEKVAEVELAHKAEQERIETLNAENLRIAEENRTLLAAATAKMIKLRKKELLIIEEFEVNEEGLYCKAGYQVSEEGIKEMSDDDWDAFILSASEAAEADAAEALEQAKEEEETPVAFPPIEEPATTKAEEFALDPEEEEEDLPFGEDEEEELPFDDEPVLKPNYHGEVPADPEPLVIDAENINLEGSVTATPVEVNHINLDVPMELTVHVTLVFTESKPFYEVAISGKFNQRIFPNQFKELATAGVEVKHEAILSDDLSFVIISR